MKAENKITYTKDFDQKFRYDGKDLGAACNEEGTIFKLWCPLADRVTLQLYTDGTGDEKKTIEMELAEKGVWQKKLSGDLHGI